MSFLATSATDTNDVLAKIRDFAVLDGWTADYDEAGKLGLSKGACKVAFQTFTTTRTNSNTGATLNDGYVRMAVCTAFAGGNTNYYGHTGSIVTSNGDADSVTTIDLTGPIANMWLFSNAAETCVHAVMQAAPDRYSFISFGILEDHGLDQPDVPFAIGHSYIWWPDSPTYFDNNACAYNWPQSGEHNIGYLDISNVNVLIQDGLLDPALGFTDGDFVTRSIVGLHNRGDSAADAYFDGQGLWLDMFLAMNNDVTTGGVPLYALPFFYTQSSIGHTYLGEVPEVRLVSMDNLSPAQELTYGSETWLVFPMKRKGELADTNFGATPQPVVNSGNYGFAFKKVT